MDNGKTGAFITMLRGELGLTQKQQADRIGVIDKDVKDLLNVKTAFSKGF